MPQGNVNPVVLKFGGGLNSAVRSADISIEECVRGQNFDLDPISPTFRRRKPFDLIGTTPNAAGVRGFAQLAKQDGSISTLIQAGTTVYTWDGADNFAAVGTVNSGSRLRGPREHNFTLDEVVLITDLDKLETVKVWDGTTFTDLTHNLGVDFYAKYCRVNNERAWFANVQAGTDTPHVVVGSAVSDYTDLSVSDRPSSSLGTNDPFFIVMPDLRPINGMESAYGEFIFSTSRGRLFHLQGTDSTDFFIQDFYDGSAVSGDEAIVNIGNDLLFGLPSRIESLRGVLEFGDVRTDDKSFYISPFIGDVVSWTLVYDRKFQKVLCFPNNQSAAWVYHKQVATSPSRGGFSPWSKWVTDHSLGFQPQTVMPIVDPLTMTEAVYMGDDGGNIYKIDGQSAQDGGTADITVNRIGGLLQLPPGQMFNAYGWVNYRKLFPFTLTITFMYQGTVVLDQPIVINVPGGGAGGASVYNGDSYYNDGGVYGFEFSERLSRQDFTAAGQGDALQVKVEISGSSDFSVEEVGIGLTASESP